DAIKMAKHVKYQGLGTWEFLYDSKTNKHYFLEVNPRIQVEHPVTEERTGLDLIELQFAIEEGRSLPTVKERENHVIEARIYAELPEKDFAQDSGKIQVLAIGEDVPGVRFDLAYQQGDTIPATYDKTLLKLIASGDNREQAIANIGNALKQLTITGVSTNREFLLWLISTNEFREGKITTTFIESAWKKHQRERLSKVESFLGNGVFAEYTKPVDLVPDELPQNLTYEKDGIQRNYREDITKFQEENPDASVFRFGIFEDRGVRFALGFWDFSKQKGSMGVEEGHSVVKFFEIAARDHLPAVMISNSSGARQHEGMLALIQMDFAASAYAENKHNIPTFVNIDYGPNLGGVKASISEFSDVKGAVNGSLIGLTGPDMVAETVGLEDRTQLPEGTLGVMEHLIEGRTIDIVFDNLDEAREHTMHLLYRLPGSNAVKDPSLFVPTDHTGSFTSLVPSIRYDRPPEHKYRTVVRQLFSKSISPLRRSSQEVSTQRTLTNEERLAILYHPYRPTATEYMSPDAGIFIDAVPLSNKNTVDSVDQVPPIVAAICTIKIPEYEDPTSIMVIAQETQRVRDDDGIITKKYVAQRPQDLRWTLRMMRYANKRDMPILFIADSTGADGSIEAHKGGITEELANVLLLAHELDVPIASLNIGQNGSGGGLIFSRPMNWAADLQYALSYVAHFKVQSRILKSRQVTDEEARDLLNKLNDARAERRRSMRQIDRVIPEPPGGAQNDPEFVARGIHGFVGEWLVKTLPLSASERKDDRRERTRIAASFATRPHQAHA
ncbi:MAG: carboxyl transferase domain-containing protein, partial [bacterium]|nr:carboxyl transferase domain-containing protein [bacterium]